MPDIPRWVETRFVLLSGRGEIFGLREEGEGHSFVVRDPGDGLAYVAGRPAGGEIRAAVARNGGAGVVVSQLEDTSHVAASLPGWNAVRAVLHLLGDTDRLPRAPAGAVRLLEPSDALDDLPPDLRIELRVAAGRSPVAAGLEVGHPVSFCYAAARTESLWDISVDTLEGFRRRGHAARCVAYMVGLMEREGLRPVWTGGVEPGLPRVGGQARVSPGGRAGRVPARGRALEDPG